MKYRIIAIPFILALLMAGFSGCGTKEAKPETEAEEAGEQQEEAVYTESVVCDDDASQGEMAFTEVVQEDADGYRLQIIRHNSFAFTDLCKLYSPAGRMLLIASGCQVCGSLGGYWIDYDSRGRVVKVCSTETCYDLEFLNEKGGEAVRQIRRLLNDSKRAESEVRYDIVRDSTGTVVRIGNVSVPFGYKGRFYVKEWGPFWESDLSGGKLALFAVLEKEETAGISYVNYLYADNHLVAELACWNGTFIKARTYNRFGSMVKQYDDRDVDIHYVTFFDFDEEPKWYVDK